MEKIEAYVDEVVSQLDCDSLERDEIRLETHTHLRQFAEAEMAAGKDAEAAQEAAIRQFGSAEDVAARLTLAHELAPAPPAAKDHMDSVVGWGLVLVPTMLLVGLLPSTLMSNIMAHLHMGASDAGETASQVGLSINYFVDNVARFLVVVVIAALARWRASRRPWLAAGLSVTSGQWLVVGYWGLILNSALSSGSSASAAALPGAIWPPIYSFGHLLVRVLLVTMLLGALMKLLPLLLPRMHWAWAAVGLVACTLWAHPVSLGLPATVHLEGGRPVTQGHEVLMLAKWVATMGAIWFAALLARALWPAAGPRRIATRSAALMAAVATAMLVPARATIPRLVWVWVGSEGLQNWMLLSTVFYVASMALAAGVVVWFAWMAENGKLPPPTKWEARLGW